MNRALPKWWEGHLQGRRPVSLRRHVFGLLVLLLIGTGFGFLSYRYITAESRLRAYAEQWLRQFSGGEARVDRVDFDPFAGLQLVGVSIATPEAAGFYPPGTPLEQRTIFSAASVRLRLQPFSVISGELIVPEIIAVNPQLTLVKRTDDAQGNWEAMLQRRILPRKRGRGAVRLPKIHLRDLEVRQYQLTQRGRAGGTVQMFKAGAKPLPDQPEVYDFKITKLITSADANTWVGETGHLQIDMATGVVSGSSLPRLSLEELRLVAPPEFKHWIDMLDPQGYVWAESLQFDPQKGTQVHLRLSGAQLSVPIDDSEAGDRSIPRHIRFSDVAGEIQFNGQLARIELQGLFRSSPFQLNGVMTLPADTANGWDGIGFELDINASGVRLPRNDEDTEQAERRFVQRWRRLAAFVHDFDGRGRVDLAAKLRKEPGEGKGIEFVEGVMTARGPSAAFDEFPYRLHDVTGEVRFRRDGRIELVNLAGHHGAGKAVINGLVGGFSNHDSVKLHIQGHDIILDPDLLDCLDADDREFCQRFLRHATFDLGIHLERPAVAPGSPRAKWNTALEAVFKDGEFLYAGFPYSLDRLQGRVRIAGGLLRLEDLSGRHGQATVRISGTATRGEHEKGSLDVQMAATDLPLDDDLAGALPEDAGSLFRQYAPSGLADINGRLYTVEEDDTPRFDVKVRLSQASVALPDSTARLADISAELQLVPAMMTIRRLEGHLGRSSVNVEGRLGLAGSHPDVDVRVRSESLELDEQLRSALPAKVRAAYDSMSPSGRVRLDLAYHEKAAMAGEAAQTGQYRAIIEPQGCRVVLSRFPYPLEGITGRIVLTPNELSIKKLSARNGAAAMELRGKATAEADITRVELETLRARNVPFSEELRRAVPWRMRRLWNDMRPTGTCDLDLKNIVVVSGPGDHDEWKGEGGIKLHDVAFEAGSRFSGLNGTLSGIAGYDRQFYFDVDARLSRAEGDDRLLTAVRARMKRPATTSIVTISDVVSRFYEGDLVGELKLDYSRKMPTYSISLTAQNVSLQQFLNAQRKTDEKPVELRGLLNGTLALFGQIGNPTSRQGSGNVVIHDAQMFKVPFLLSILQIVHLSADSNAFTDATLEFLVDGDEVIFENIDLRGKALSMVGAGRVRISDTAMHLILLVGSPLKLPRVAVLSELLEGVARELMEVHVEGTLDKPELKAKLVRGLTSSIEAMTALRSRAVSPDL